MNAGDLDQAVELREEHGRAGKLRDAAKLGPLTLFFWCGGDKFTLGEIVDEQVIRDAIMTACEEYRQEKVEALAKMGVTMS